MTRVADVGGHAFADAGDGEQQFGVGVRGDEAGDLRGLLFDGFGGATVGANAEGVGAVDFEQRSGFIEESCDCEIVHGD